MLETSKTTNGARSTPKRIGGATVVGVTHDGVEILRGKGRPTQFSLQEIREAVAEVRAERLRSFLTEAGSENTNEGRENYEAASKWLRNAALRPAANKKPATKRARRPAK